MSPPQGKIYQTTNPGGQSGNFFYRKHIIRVKIIIYQQFFMPFLKNNYLNLNFQLAILHVSLVMVLVLIIAYHVSIQIKEYVMIVMMIYLMIV